MGALQWSTRGKGCVLAKACQPQPGGGVQATVARNENRENHRHRKYSKYRTVQTVGSSAYLVSRIMKPICFGLLRIPRSEPSLSQSGHLCFGMALLAHRPSCSAWVPVGGEHLNRRD